VLAGSHTLKKFWEGFSNVSKRLRDDDGEPALLKLKDWPSPGNTGEEFSETLPSHSANILSGLPLTAYTDRGEAGMFNLAANLPDVFVRPDLGPRSYISYGDSQSPDCGTYNLHLELADTLWIVVRAETPSDLDKPEYKNQVRHSVSTAKGYLHRATDCCVARRRAKLEPILPACCLLRDSKITVGASRPL
jgi:lysine-specific demethylase 3